MALKIGFLTTLGHNVGDEFIREGIRAALDAAGAAYAPLYVHKLSEDSLHEPAEDESVSVADKYWDSDLFIQGGAPVYWHLQNGTSTSLTSEWHRWMWEDRILAGGQAAGAGRRHPLFLNLGAGSCQPWGENGDTFLADAECVDFARRAGERSELTTVRDPVASRLLTTLGIAHRALPCPAFLAAARHRLDVAPSAGYLGINLMPLGGHFDLTAGFDAARWHEDCLRLTTTLRRLGPLVFVAHDAAERDFMQRFAVAGERVYLSASWRDYLDLYAGCALVVANRVHGAVCAAGFGVPGIILGNDTRAEIGCALDLTLFQSGVASPQEIATAAARLLADRKHRAGELRALREDTLQTYAQLLRTVLEKARQSGGTRRAAAPRASAALASVAELESDAFRGWMDLLNTFAAQHGLRTFTDWSKVWEYPWLWRHALGRLDWPGRRLVDLGSEISPMPWFLATLGARVTLIETDAQWVPRWQALRERLGVDVDWHVVDSERLPLGDAEADALTSFSVIEHQPDKRRALDEVARVLKPGGTLAISFDICEPNLGMTFPGWNGHALTLREFEEFVWQHPSFDAGATPDWNRADMAAFRTWNLRSAPHHNYVVAAAVLTRRDDREAPVPG